MRRPALYCPSLSLSRATFFITGEVLADESYYILRCKPSLTLETARDLYARGIRAWAPRWWRRLRLPRKRKHITVLSPVLPGFLFVHDDDLDFALSLSEAYQVPKLRLMVVNDAYACVRLKELHDIGTPEEPCEAPTAPDKLFKPGDRVRVGEGPLSGFTGAVRAVQRGYVEIQIDASPLKIKIPPLLIEKSHI